MKRPWPRTELCWGRRIRTALLLLFATAGMLYLSGGATAHRKARPAFNRDNLIRLHILANSDRPEDQRVKLLVRDRLLQESRTWLLGAGNAKNARQILADRKREMLAIVLDELKRNRMPYGARLELGVFPFPARDYPFGRLPPGPYQALRVALGRGEGHNWWCVLFPPLCFMTDEEKERNFRHLGRGKTVYRCLFLERILGRGSGL